MAPPISTKVLLLPPPETVTTAIGRSLDHCYGCFIYYGDHRTRKNMNVSTACGFHGYAAVAGASAVFISIVLHFYISTRLQLLEYNQVTSDI